jgi:hypothetical protein
MTMRDSYRILHREDGYWVVQYWGNKSGVLSAGWFDRTHSKKENVFLWETKEQAAAYLCGISINWIEPLNKYQAMALAVEESETF